MTLEIKKEKAQEAFEQAGSEGKRLLANLFGLGTFCYKMTERVKTFQHVLDYAGECAGDYAVPDNASNEVKAAMYYKRLKLIAKVFNGDWKADLGDVNQRKYYIWFNIIANAKGMGSSGFGLSVHAYDYDRTFARLGARPYFKDSDTALYVGKQFLEEFNQWANYMNLSE